MVVTWSLNIAIAFCIMARITLVHDSPRSCLYGYNMLAASFELL